jgi:hypothetical protein
MLGGPPPADLRSQYAFSHSQLKQQFLAVSHRINLDHVMCGKQHDLILFREYCYAHKIEVPRQLFGCDPSGCSATESQAFRQVLEWETYPAVEHLDVITMSTYTGAPWIVDYFVISTFPAVFGQFTSDEYMAAAARFLAT